MLKILGPNQGRFCDGVSRRNFLQLGALGIGGLTLPQLLEAEARAGIRRSHKAVINIFLPGGPPHQDMFDLKPDAPSEVRGEFKPIKTNVPGLEVGELFPMLAKCADKFTVIRSMVGAAGGHDAFQCHTGRAPRNQPAGGWPAMGAVMSKLQGTTVPGMPAFVGLAPNTGHRPWGDPGQAGFLGPAHSAFKPNKEGKDDMVLNGVSAGRLDERRSLLTSFDQFRRDVDNSGVVEGLDAFHQQAFAMLTSSKLAVALDLNQEDPKLRERYGRGFANFKDDGSHRLLDDFLMARRLVEAGVRCVTLAFSRWDWHSNNFGQAREEFPLLDQGLSALIEDLHARGLDRDVSVVVWGEFGRTPKINKEGGRDHWPNVSFALLAGGGMRHGQVIGATGRDAGECVERPVKFGDVFATLYQQLGLDASNSMVNDLTGRPQHLVEPGCEVIRELV